MKNKKYTHTEARNSDYDADKPIFRHPFTKEI